MGSSTAVDSSITFDLSTVPVEHQQRVAALIPDQRLAVGYVHRSVDGFEDFDIFDVAVEEAENICLAGPTGSSKTTVFRAYAAARGLPFIRVNCNASMDPTVLIGRTTIAPDGTVAWCDGNLTLVARYGGVILFDEVNMAHPRITAAWHELMDVARSLSIPENDEIIKVGRGGLGEPQPGLIGCAYNDGRYQGTVRLNEAFNNRLPLPMKWGYLAEVEEQLVDSPRLLNECRNMRSLAEIRTPVSTNMMQEFERHSRRFNVTFAIGRFADHFPTEEEGPVRRALEAGADAIASELGLK
jgi:hypothetical protein